MSRRIMLFVRRNAIALLALFIALGGVSYAAVKLPKNSVGTKQLKKNAVNSQKVKNRSLLAKDFKRGQLPKGAKGDPGPAGTPGAPGATGPTGPTGAVDLANSGIVVNGPITGGETGVTESTPFTQFGTVEIDAPADGYVLVTSVMPVRNNGTVTGVCAPEMRLRYDGDLVGPNAVATFNPSDATIRYEQLVISHAVQVPEGPTLVESMMRINPNVSPGCDVNILTSGARMTALWVPYSQVD